MSTTHNNSLLKFYEIDFIYNTLAEDFLEQIEQNALSPQEKRTIGAFVIKHVPILKNRSDLDQFLTNLVERFPFFHKAAAKIRKEFQMDNPQQKEPQQKMEEAEDEEKMIMEKIQKILEVQK